MPVRVVAPFTCVQLSAAFGSLYARYWPSKGWAVYHGGRIGPEDQVEACRGRKGRPIGRLGS